MCPRACLHVLIHVKTAGRLFVTGIKIWKRLEKTARLVYFEWASGRLQSDHKGLHIVMVIFSTKSKTYQYYLLVFSINDHLKR